MLVDGARIVLEATPLIRNGRTLVPVIAAGKTMLPLRFVVESLGAIVTYKAVSKVITIVWTH